MLSELYTIASGLMAQQKKLETEGNNIVNSQTPGYRTQRAVAVPFEEELSYRLENGNTGEIGHDTPMTIVKNVSTKLMSIILNRQTGIWMLPSMETATLPYRVLTEGDISHATADLMWTQQVT